MARFEARQMSMLWLVIPAVFLILAAGFIISGTAVAAGALLAAFMLLLAYVFISKGKIKSYNVDASGISAEGGDARIALSEIVGVLVMSPPRGFGGVFQYEGASYGRNADMASGSMPLMPISEVVLVFTTNTGNALRVRNCYVLTPKDKEGFVKEIRERLKAKKR